MSKIIKQTKNITKRDIINGRFGFAVQDVADKDEIKNIVGAAIIETEDSENGDIMKVAILKTKDGDAFQSISKTFVDAMEDGIDLIDEEGSVDIRIRYRKGKESGNEFITPFFL